MKNFLLKKDREIVEERIKITSHKINERKRYTEHFLLCNEDLRSYVRIQYLLGEPCWGDYSPVNNFSMRAWNIIKYHSNTDL